MSDVHGTTAPSISGIDLARNAVRFPEDLPPGPCLTLFAFSPTHQSEAMTWAAVLRDLATSGTAAIRQVIVLPAIAKMGEGMVLEQLKKNVPADAHGGTLLAFTDAGKIAKSLGAPDTKHIALALLDASRTVVWTGSGEHSADAEAALRAKVG